MKIEIYGTGCAKCKRLTQAAEQAAQELGVDYELQKVEDLDAIVAAGVMRTPALAVDGVLRLSGQVPSVSALREILAG
jgi:small redox-active disulfide protein 2